ncbi:hypothetical protein CEP52_004279 [Fusarium oligoseptatum]|uniref:Atrophied bacterial Ig domain-containing protein n=1 Tax=Fusarium oligoseptatum TaxID=2604345 RepID=A0A428U4M3_9HYPO|nr:hypothetical protein CEP52_004279 [Fusarium oligoseptatum]
MHVAMQFFQLLPLAFITSVLADEASLAQIESALSSLSVTNIEDVRGNIYLPTDSDGFAVTWNSSNPSVISNDGVVSRQGSDTIVSLVATIESGDEVLEREFKASVRQKTSIGAFEAYAFSYFTGSSIAGENIFFASSNGNNALDWKELNGGQAVIKSKFGTKGLRDPFIIRSPEGDTFYLIATDLSIGSGTSWGAAVRQGSLYLEVWESHDLINWSEQRHIKVSPDNAGNTWAPEAFWDSEQQAYVVFWASSLYAADDPNHTGSSYHRMLYSLTRDFVTFSTPEIWQDTGDARIDTTVIKSGNTLYRFTKDEGAVTGCTDIIQEKATCIGAKAGTKAIEGPTAFRSNAGDAHGEKFYLFVDEYGGRGYIPLETADIDNPSWKVSSSYKLPTSPRHGTVIPITAEELEALDSALGA